MSLDAQIFGPEGVWIHPVCEMLHPQLPTCSTASSSSSSVAFEVQIRPSDEAERRILWEDEQADPSLRKWSAVMSSEWVEA